MGLPRLLGALAAVTATALALAALWTLAGPPLGETAQYPIQVIGPGGVSIFDGVVPVENATALSVLRAAGTQGGFAVESTYFAAYGAEECGGHYVTSVAGYEAGGSSGWVYRVLRGPTESSWSYPAHSAACEGLHEGDRLQWHWTDSPVKES